MIMWFISRLASYLVVFEFINNMLEYSARGFVTVKPTVSLSQIVDIVDDALPIAASIFYELILISLVFSIVIGIYKIKCKSAHRHLNIHGVMSVSGKIFMSMGITGLISRLLTYISIQCFYTSLYHYEYTAITRSLVRDAFYIVLAMTIFALKKDDNYVEDVESIKTFVCNSCGKRVVKPFQTCPYCNAIGMIKKAESGALPLTAKISATNEDVCSPTSFTHHNNTPKTTPELPVSKSLPQAVPVTDIHQLSNHYGEFVKIAINGLENENTFRLRHPDLSRAVSEVEAKSILAKPLTELGYTTMRGTIFVKVEPISVIPSKSYEDNHYIYGILRRKPNEHYVLTNAFITAPDSHLQIIVQALSSQGMFEYSTLDDGTISIFNFTSDSLENLEIPEKIDGKVVTAISRDAFANNQVIKSLKVPDTVKTIDYGAFCSCNNLESVVLGDGVETLNVAFDVCKELKNVYIGKAVSKVNDSFHNCHKISAFEVSSDSEHLCVIDGVLFSKDKTVLIRCPCGKKGKYTIPVGTKVIGENAFETTGLEEIVISNTVERIEFDAFAWAYDIKKLTIPSSVVEIEYDAITTGNGDFEGEITVEQGSYAQQYFEDFYEDYKLVILDKPKMTDATVSTPISKTDRLFCRRCGSQLPLDSVFCFKCGTKVDNDVV